MDFSLENTLIENQSVNPPKEETTEKQILQPVVLRKNRLPALPNHESLMKNAEQAKAFIKKCSVTPRRMLERYARAWLKPEMAKDILNSIEEDSVAIASYIITLAAVDIFSGEDGSPPSLSDFNVDRLNQVMPVFEAFNTMFCSKNGMKPEDIRKQLFEVELRQSVVADRLYSFLEKTCSLIGNSATINAPDAFLCALDNSYDVRVAKQRYTFTKKEVESKKPRRKCPITGRAFREGDTAIELYFLFRVTGGAAAAGINGEMIGEASPPEQNPEGIETFARKIWISDTFMPGWMCCLPNHSTNGEAVSEAEEKLNMTHAARRAKTDNLTVVDAVACMIDMIRIPEWLNRRLKPSMAKLKATASGLLKNEEQYRQTACEEVKKNSIETVSKETLALFQKRKTSKIEERYYQFQWVCFSERGILDIIELIYQIKQLQIMFLAISSLAIQRAKRGKEIREAASLKRKKTIQAKQEKERAVDSKKDKEGWIKKKSSSKKRHKSSHHQ